MDCLSSRYCTMTERDGKLLLSNYLEHSVQNAVKPAERQKQ
jgi:hypothetical protein